MRNLQKQVKNKLFQWSQNFCKFSAFSLEFQKFSSITRTILVTKDHFAQNCQLEKMHAKEILIFYKSLLNCMVVWGILLMIESIQIYLLPNLGENPFRRPSKDSCHLWSRWWSVLLLDRYGDIIVPSTIFFPVILAKAFKIDTR